MEMERYLAFKWELMAKERRSLPPGEVEWGSGLNWATSDEDRGGKGEAEGKEMEEKRKGERRKRKRRRPLRKLRSGCGGRRTRRGRSHSETPGRREGC